jgi:PAS domain S-box-containing protein
MLVREPKHMQKWRDQHALSILDEELYRLDASICEVPYSALPLEKPEVICFAGRIEELTGYSADDILADKQLWLSMVHPADRNRVFGVFTYCKNQGLAFAIEYRITDKNGSLHWIIDKGEPVFNDKGQVIQIDGAITDISEYKKAKIYIYQKNPRVTKSKNINLSVF